MTKLTNNGHGNGNLEIAQSNQENKTETNNDSSLSEGTADEEPLTAIPAENRFTSFHGLDDIDRSLGLNFPKFELEKLLNTAPYGKDILAYYRLNNKLDGTRRTRLVDIITKEIYNYVAAHRLKHEQYLLLTQKITKLFPRESEATYYIPYIPKRTAGTAKGILARGRLVDKLRNLLHQSGDTIRHKRKRNNKSQQNSVNFLKNFKEPWEELIKHWRATLELRKTSQQQTLNVFIESWPVLKDLRVEQLINIDFEQLHGQKCSLNFFEEWNNFIETVILEEGLSRIRDKTILENYNDNREESSKEAKFFCELNVLCHLLPPKSRTKIGKKECWKFSIRESVESIVKFVELPGDVEQVIKDTKAKAEVRNLQELISEKGLGRRKRVIMVVGGAVSLIVIALIVAIVIILTDSSAEAAALEKQPKAIALEDILDGRLNPKNFNGTWISGNEILYKSEAGDIRLYNTDKLKSEVLLPANTPVLATAIDYSLSADHKFLLVAHDFQKLYRHSYVAQYTIVNLETKGTSSLNAHGEIVLQVAVWAPVGNAVVFVSRNNIFYRESATSNTVRQITTDGLIGNIYNGVPDWVYEEEVFSSNKAVWISPDGKKLAYAKFSDTFVKLMTLPVYGEPGSLDFQYTRAVQVRYPKPGTRNPFVSLHVADLEKNAATLNLEPPSNVADKEPILSTVAWATNDVVSAIWMNRVQNEATIVTYSAREPFTTEIVKNLNLEGGWMELFTPPIFSKNGSYLLLILSHDQGNNAGSYRHVTLLNREANAAGKPLTIGKFVVTEILGWDEENHLVYYQGNTPTDSSVQHVFSVSTDTKDTKCLTCGDPECTYNSAEFSDDFKQSIINCEGPGAPKSTVFSRDKRLAVWEGNEEIKSIIEDTQIPKIKKLSFEVADGFTANVLLKLPPNLDASGNTKYPMLVNVYGGPDSYQVVDRFNLDWGSYLAANKSIIYATIDGRGSGLRGDKLLFSLYRRLGTVEIIDQINVTKQIQEKLPYVDASRTAIWGWSYGGFASGMALATDTDGIFKCGISVAPVTDWTLYDSIYTERFMGLPTPEDNLKGYEDAELVLKYEGLRDKLYFLIHGTLDDNVHYQQSMLWAKQLEQKDILFRQMSYPDEDHGLASVRPHLYHSLENFLDECFVEDE